MAMAPESQKEENVLTILFREWCVEDKLKKNPNRDGSVLVLMLTQMSLLPSRIASGLVESIIIWSNGHRRPKKTHGNPHQKSKKLPKVSSLNLKKINLVSTDRQSTDIFTGNIFHNRFYSEDQEYEVEALVDRKRVGSAVKYLVKWKGFGS